MTLIVTVIITLLVGLAAGYFLGNSLMKKSVENLEEEARKNAENILREAKHNAESIKKDKMLEAKEHFIKLKDEFNEDANRRKNQIVQNEQRVKNMQQQVSKQM